MLTEEQARILFDLERGKIYSKEGKELLGVQFQPTGNVYHGVDYSTNSRFYGLQLKYKYKIFDNIHLSLGILATKENIEMPRIVNDSNFNLSNGVSLHFII